MIVKQKDMEIDQYKNERDKVLSQTHGLLQYVKTSCTEGGGNHSANIKTKSHKKVNKKDKNQPICTDEQAKQMIEQFPNLNSKTINISEIIIDQYKAALEQSQNEKSNSTSIIEQMQEEIEQEKRVKKEIHSEFQKIKAKVDECKQWEQESNGLRMKNEWLLTHIRRINQMHTKLSVSAYNQLCNIKEKFQSSNRIASEVNFGRLLQIEQEIQQDMKLGAFQSSNEFENKMRQEV